MRKFFLCEELPADVLAQLVVDDDGQRIWLVSPTMSAACAAMRDEEGLVASAELFFAILNELHDAATWAEALDGVEQLSAQLVARMPRQRQPVAFLRAAVARLAELEHAGAHRLRVATVALCVGLAGAIAVGTADAVAAAVSRG